MKILVSSACTSGIILFLISASSAMPFVMAYSGHSYFTPIFLPIAQSLGMSDIQFGVMLIFNMCLGNMTPPVDSVLFVGCGSSKISTALKTLPKLGFHTLWYCSFFF